MESVVYIMCCIGIYLALCKPEKEKLAFRLLAISFAASAILFLMAGAKSIAPTVAM